MDHVKSDKRTQRSALKIYRSLVSCLHKKDFSEITVTDIQRDSGIARSTFYRSFDNLLDVLTWYCNLCFQQILSQLTQDMFFDEIRFLPTYFSFWLTRSDVLETLLAINRPDIIYASHLKNAELLWDKFPYPKVIPQNAEYFMAIRTGVTISILLTWIKNGKQETPEELTKIVKNQLKILSQNTVD
ncbi:hypothetical protein [Levilactobacillus bambusae]|uniref:HTH tetR-type domain-containing protein n=1 Tax=Levilactobacillus bambusae TaxID=2024736 RepID=A0A2V1MZQ5_9LACO|nr:hypothetical protein [Levilactobacillus bambusae]PWG00501.1 hypothetical protein DCM90_06140 [Levilactobacillus bambusae]